VSRNAGCELRKPLLRLDRELRNRFSKAFEVKFLAVDECCRDNGYAERASKRSRQIEERRAVGLILRFQ